MMISNQYIFNTTVFVNYLESDIIVFIFYIYILHELNTVGYFQSKEFI